MVKKQTPKPIRRTHIFSKNNATNGEWKNVDRISHNQKWDLRHLHLVSKGTSEETLGPTEQRKTAQGV